MEKKMRLVETEMRFLDAKEKALLETSQVPRHES